MLLEKQIPCLLLQGKHLLSEQKVTDDGKAFYLSNYKIIQFTLGSQGFYMHRFSHSAKLAMSFAHLLKPLLMLSLKQKAGVINREDVGVIFVMGSIHGLCLEEQPKHSTLSLCSMCSFTKTGILEWCFP